MLVVLIAVGAALAYGVSDFLAGVAARRVPTLPVTALGNLVATALLVAVVAVDGGPGDAGVGAGALAGVAVAVGLAAFYAAMAIGPMSLLSPVIAVGQAVVGVVVAVAGGERLAAGAWLAMLLGLAAIGLLARPPKGSGERERVTRRGLATAMVASLGIGLSLVALDRAPADAGLTPALVETGVCAAVLVATIGLGRASGAVRRALARLLPAPAGGAVSPGRAWGTAAAAGVLLAAANALILVGLQQGNLAVVAVLVSLYPLATVLLAGTVLRERLGRGQVGGIGLALAASALFALA